MRIIGGKEYMSPREVLEQGLITNSKGKPDYNFILRLIRRGELDAAILNETSQTPYYLIEKKSIDKYVAKFESTKFLNK